jgi:hypothetical protein
MKSTNVKRVCNFRKNSTLLHIFNFYLQKLEQSGVLDHLRIVHFAVNRNALEDGCDNRGGVGIGYRTTILGFVLFAGGLTASIAVGVVEWWTANSKPWRGKEDKAMLGSNEYAELYTK